MVKGPSPQYPAPLQRPILPCGLPRRRHSASPRTWRWLWMPAAAGCGKVEAPGAVVSAGWI
jgi:hypothetical protein